MGQFRMNIKQGSVFIKADNTHAKNSVLFRKN